MKCDEALDAMLEAEPAELNGEESSTLGQHLRDCAGCGAMAASLRAGQTHMTAGYQRLHPRRGAAEAASAVLASHAGVAGAGAGNVRLQAVAAAAGKRRRRTTAAFITLAMAAVLVIAVLRFGGDSRAGAVGGGLGGRGGSPSSRRSPVEVELAQDQNAIVFTTRNPNITVVWLYSGD